MFALGVSSRSQRFRLRLQENKQANLFYILFGFVFLSLFSLKSSFALATTCTRSEHQGDSVAVRCFFFFLIFFKAPPNPLALSKALSVQLLGLESTFAARKEGERIYNKVISGEKIFTCELPLQKRLS